MSTLSAVDQGPGANVKALNKMTHADMTSDCLNKTKISTRGWGDRNKIELSFPPKFVVRPLGTGTWDTKSEDNGG